MERFATAGEHLKGSGPHSSRRDFLCWAAAGVAAGVAEALAGPPPRTQRGAPGGRTSPQLTPEQQAIVDRFAPLLEAVRKEGGMTIEHHVERMGLGDLGPSIVPPERYIAMKHTVFNDITGAKGMVEVLQIIPRDFCDQYHLSTQTELLLQNRSGQWESVEPSEDTYEASLVQSDTGNTLLLWKIKLKGNYRVVGRHTYIRGQYNLRDPRAEQAIRNGFPGIDALLAATINAEGNCRQRALACVSTAQGLHLPYQVITLEGASGWPGDLELYGNRHFINALQNQQGFIAFLDGRGDRPDRGTQGLFVVCNRGNLGYVQEFPSTRKATGANRGGFAGALSTKGFGVSVHIHGPAHLTEAEAALARGLIDHRNAQAYRGQCTAQLQ